MLMLGSWVYNCSLNMCLPFLGWGGVQVNGDKLVLVAKVVVCFFVKHAHPHTFPFFFKDPLPSYIYSWVCMFRAVGCSTKIIDCMYCLPVLLLLFETIGL